MLRILTAVPKFAVTALIVGIWMTWTMLSGPLTHAFGKAATARVDVGRCTR